MPFSLTLLAPPLRQNADELKIVSGRRPGLVRTLSLIWFCMFPEKIGSFACKKLNLSFTPWLIGLRKLLTYLKFMSIFLFSMTILHSFSSSFPPLCYPPHKIRKSKSRLSRTKFSHLCISEIRIKHVNLLMIIR